MWDLFRHAFPMPIDFVGFTADRKITATIPLADDRLSDMLNSVTRIVLRDAVVGDLVEGGPSLSGDVTLPVGDLVAVVGTGRRGSESRRRRTAVRRVSVGLGRYTVSGCLHVDPNAGDFPRDADPASILAGRDILVPITDASISYDCENAKMTEEHETILVNRARANWIDILPEVDKADDADLNAESDAAELRTRYVKDFTGTVAD
jgi:hypothetical protein